MRTTSVDFAGRLNQDQTAQNFQPDLGQNFRQKKIYSCERSIVNEVFSVFNDRREAVVTYILRM